MPLYPGNILTATAATVSASPTSTRTWQWLRSGSAIPTATNSTYTITNADIDAMLSVQQIETNLLGLASATSAETEAVSAAAPTPAILFALAEPGVWYDPSDVANLNWRRNQLLWSEQISNATWVKAAVTSVTPTAGAAPNGTSSADLVLFAAGGRLGQPVTVAANRTVSVSLRVKRVNRDYHVLAVASNSTSAVNSAIARFNLQTLALENTENLGTGFAIVGTPTITSSTNGYVVLSVQATVTGTAAALYTAATEGTTQNTASAGAECYLWGAQLELGSTASTYQPITDLNTEVLALFPNATLYQDRSGSIPVTTPGQFVGVRLDKSRGLTLGPELAATLPTPAISDASGSVGTWDAVTRTFGNTGANVANRPRFSFNLGLVTGRDYLVTGQVSGAIAQLNTVTLAGGVNIYNAATGVISGRVRAFGNFIEFIFSLNAGSTVTISSISVKELAGNLSFAPTDAARMTYGIEPKTGTRNILTFTEQFENAIWLKGNLLAFGSGSTANATTAPDGTLTADLITPPVSTSLGNSIGQSFANAASQAYTLSFSVKANGENFVQLLWHNTLSTNYANFNITAGTAGAVTAGTYTDATITPQGNDWFRCTITSTLAIATQSALLSIIPSGTSLRGAVYNGDGIKGVYVWGGQLERSATATAYQRVAAASDVTEAGVASCHYVQYDGTDDSMSTAAIDFTSTDAMSVFAGVFKRTDANLAIFLESSVDSVNTNGTFSVRAPSGAAAATYSYISRGTALSQVATPTNLPAPRYNLVAALSDISVDQAVIRVNGAQVGTTAADQGTGNYGNHQLFIGRRNNASLQFAGRDYGIIIVGKSLSAGDLASTETWLADKTPGVTL